LQSSDARITSVRLLQTPACEGGRPVTQDRENAPDIGVNSGAFATVTTTPAINVAQPKRRQRPSAIATESTRPKIVNADRATVALVAPTRSVEGPELELLDDFTFEQAVAVIGYVMKGWSFAKSVLSLIDGTDLDVATQINNAKQAIINEIHLVVEQDLENKVESSIRNWFEISQTIAQNPDGNNTIMTGRISDLLNTTQDAWVGLKNSITTSQDMDSVRRMVPAFNTLAVLRVTIMKDMRQLNPPMPVPDGALQPLIVDTLKTNYLLTGNKEVDVLADDFFQVYENTVEGKKFRPLFHPQAQYQCEGDCAGYVFISGVGAVRCTQVDQHVSTIVHGSNVAFSGTDYQCPLCPADLFHGDLAYSIFTPLPSCVANGDAADEALMDADPTIMVIKASMKAIVAEFGELTFGQIQDDVYFPNQGGTIFPSGF
jgi:hypothetical protein